LKELYEIGLVFRGFVVVNYHLNFRDEGNQLSGPDKDLRGAFISAISSFVETAFKNTSLEYLESGSVLFIFKMGTVQSSDSNSREPIILYGLVQRPKKKPDKLVNKFFEKITPILELFIQTYNGKDFCELSQFESFKEEIQAFFE
jgi:hypothetical protein